MLEQIRKLVVGILKGWFTNKNVLDKLSESEDGILLFDGEMIQGGGGGGSSGGGTGYFEDYSEEEKVIGRWTDGKPVYRKIIYCNSPGTKGTEYAVQDLTNLNIEKLSKFFGYLKYVKQETNSIIEFNPINWQHGSSTFSAAGVHGRIADNNLFISVGIDAYINQPLTVILEYTKTTDAPNSFKPSMIQGAGGSGGGTISEINCIALGITKSSNSLTQLATTSDPIVKFNRIVYQNNIDCNLDNGTIKLKANKQYEIHAKCLSAGVKALSTYSIYNLTDNIPLTIFNTAPSNADTSASDSHGMYIIKPDKDIEVVIRLERVGSGSIAQCDSEQYTGCYFIVKELSAISNSSPSAAAPVELTEEHLTGETFNGKPVYEKMFTLPKNITVSGNTWSDSLIPISENKIDFILEGIIYDIGDTYNVQYSVTVANDSSYANLRIMHHRNSNINYSKVKLKYTKTTD